MVGRTAARIYEVEVTHHRAAPVTHHIRQRSYLWYVDIDDLPYLPLLARFDSVDHFGDARTGFRANVTALLEQHGIDIGGGQVTMLTQPRSFGYVFNPLTLFWCHDPNGELRCVVAEVHNTYGERHPYLLFPDDGGRAEIEKAFYVSPFYPVDGYYRMNVGEPGERLAITITLHRPNERPFTASVRGVSRPATRRSALRLALRYPFSTQRTRIAITRHGVALFLKGLPVMARPGRKSVATRLQDLAREFSGLDLPVRLRAWDGSVAEPSDGMDGMDGPTVVLRSRRALRRIAARPGELGLARAYVSGDLDVEGDLTDGFRRVWAAAATRPSTGSFGWRQRAHAVAELARLGIVGRPPKPPASEARIAGRLHSRTRDRAVIAHHYDLSNEFYELLLDESMAYSAAYFTTPGQTMAEAQRAKLDLICRKLDLQSGQRLLDVGCGWGSLVLHAAEHYGVHATGITLSEQQRQFISKRVAERGLTDRVRVELRDYRELVVEQPFDAVSSIEMGEHVGEQHYPIYASTMYAALRPGGRLLLQQMSRRAGTAPGGGPFIEAYIAPDMHMRPLPSTLAFLEQAKFEVAQVEGMREQYVLTARAWLANFENNYDTFVALVGEEVARVWRLYLVGGALSFEEGRMGVDQVLAVHPA